MPEPATVLWDLDGTLVDSEPLHHAAIERLLSARGIQAPAGFQQKVIGLPAFATYMQCRELGYDGSFDEWSEAKYRHYLKRAPGIVPHAAPIGAYRSLAERGRAQAIVSNSDRLIVQANLAAAGLQRPDQITVSRNDVREGKPAAEPYLRAAWLLGVSPEHCIVVEDSAAGATAGVAAGMRVIVLAPDDRDGPDWPDGVARVLRLPTLTAEDLVECIDELSRKTNHHIKAAR
ncbi:HAD family phosphatase [Salinisphaera sp.]|uniref:HAD family hydrolase n=1 Tax=Salinisphaera sp. TaxID=1914330 RepID=UPI002D76F574|nr:HAD family phosphatase [Salinisphaera sp.]HET7313089.1 HAD family phosphatase [Salinisphaera sp.]